MTFLNVNFLSRETIFKSFNQIADTISNNVQIKINEAYYRIIDFEFYCFGDQFQDPHTYKSTQQLENGNFYLHASGIDITFGDGTNYGGILLRSIVKLYGDSGKDFGFMTQQFDGPQNVATELFSNLNRLDGSNSNDIRLIDIEGHNQDACFTPAFKILKIKRVGLTSKINDLDDYYKNAHLRYIAVLQKFPKFKQTIKGIESILEEQIESGEIDRKEAVEILGYNRSFK